MKRRGFLGLLALLPAVPMLIREAIATDKQKPRLTTLSWYERDKQTGQWVHYTVRIGGGKTTVSANGEVIDQRFGEMSFTLPPADASYREIDEFIMTLHQPASGIQWPATARFST